MDSTPSGPRPEDVPTTAMSSDDADALSTDAQQAVTEKAGTADDADPKSLGDFKLLRRLGSGGMAEVWLAEQTSLHRNVAIKLLRRELTTDATYLRRFDAEAKAAAGLDHPNIVQVYSVGEIDGQHFIAQEYVQGQTLKTLLTRKGPLGAQVALHIMRQVAAALIAAAERGIVHRDIKPENIMLNRKGEVKVADFGLAQVVQGEPLHLTQEGVTMGTPLYMSPEQVKGKKLDQRSDIYSFGVTCYHMLTGRPPFHGESAVAVAVQHVQEEPEALAMQRPDLPRAICDLVQRMMAKDPEARHPDAKALLADVRRLLKAYKQSGVAQEEALAELAGPDSSRSAGNAKQIAIAIAACLALAGVGAAIGWMQRTPSLLALERNPQAGVRQAESARDQYLQAQFSGGLEEEWQAVRKLWQGKDDEDWRILATEQLALLYLKQPDRADDARRELEELASYDNSSDGRYALEAKLGEAYLAVVGSSSADFRRAAAILSASRQQFEEKLTGSWDELYDDLRERIREAQQQPDNQP